MNKTTKERFDDKWICSMGGCFEWLSSLDNFGRALFWFEGRARKASRVSWFLNTGEWPSNDLLVCHHCDNPKCVRFDHLFLGSHKDNMQDCIRKGRFEGGKNAPRGSSHFRAKLNEGNVEIIKQSHGVRGSDLARMFNVSPQSICDIRKGRAWALAHGNK